MLKLRKLVSPHPFKIVMKFMVNFFATVFSDSQNVTILTPTLEKPRRFTKPMLANSVVTLKPETNCFMFYLFVNISQSNQNYRGLDCDAGPTQTS